MTASVFPGGFKDSIIIRGLPLTLTHPGKIFWVGNGAGATSAASTYLQGQKTASDGNQGTFNAPFATIDYAIGQCSADRGDIIMVKPYHQETISAAGGIASDVANVAIIGLGTGTAVPRIRWGAATATWTVTAINQTFYNLNLQANFSDVAVGMNVSGVDGLTWDTIQFTEAGTDLNWVNPINLATGADNLVFSRCKFITNDIANTSHINGVAHDGLYIYDSVFFVNAAQSVVTGLIATSGNATNVEIKRCSFRSNVDGALWVDFNGAANSGIVAECYVSSLDTAGATSTGDFTGGHFFQCFVSGEADAFGLVGGGGVVYNNA